MAALFTVVMPVTRQQVLQQVLSKKFQYMLTTEISLAKSCAFVYLLCQKQCKEDSVCTIQMYFAISVGILC
jgi:hypothetical protein